MRGSWRVRHGGADPESLVQEQDHQIDLATALGEEVPDVSRLRKRKG
jgi:hypothetical protein